MIGKLKTLFEQIGAKDKNESITSPISKNLITAALMIEVMQADFSLDEREQQAFISVLKQSFDLEKNEVIELEELYFGEHPFDEDQFIAKGNEMLEGVSAFWDDLEEKRLQ